MQTEGTDLLKKPPHRTQLQPAQQEVISDGDREIPRSSFWYVPFPPPSPSPSRNLTLNKLHDLFHQTPDSLHVVTLMTIGRAAKTRSAIAYAYRFRADYNAVFWLHAASQQFLLKDIRILAHLLRFPEQDAHDQCLLSALKHWLANHGPWLLILEDIEETAMVASVLPLEGAGHVLLTT